MWKKLLEYGWGGVEKHVYIPPHTTQFTSFAFSTILHAFPALLLFSFHHLSPLLSIVFYLQTPFQHQVNNQPYPAIYLSIPPPFHLFCLWITKVNNHLTMFITYRQSKRAKTFPRFPLPIIFNIDFLCFPINPKHKNRYVLYGEGGERCGKVELR